MAWNIRFFAFAMLLVLSKVATGMDCSHLLHELRLAIGSQTVSVFASQNAGAYYCEHAYCVSAQSATENPAVGVNSEGEKLVGFIHIAHDQHSIGTQVSYSQSQRHKVSRFLVGVALKDYFLSLCESLPDREEYTILVAGFGRFTAEAEDGSPVEVTNNPSQEFVENEENISAAMEFAFGSGQQPQHKNRDQLEFKVTAPDRTEKRLVIQKRILPVDDGSINPSLAGSLPNLIDELKPNAIISTGVAPYYSVELRATDAGLEKNQGHDPDSPATTEIWNRSIWRAILNSGR